VTIFPENPLLRPFQSGRRVRKTPDLVFHQI